MTEYWVSVKIFQGSVGSTYSRAHKIEGSETFGDLIEQLPDVQKDRVAKVGFQNIYTKMHVKQILFNFTF